MLLCQLYILGISFLEVHLGSWTPPPTAVILIMRVKSSWIHASCYRVWNLVTALKYPTILYPVKSWNSLADYTCLYIGNKGCLSYFFSLRSVTLQITQESQSKKFSLKGWVITCTLKAETFLFERWWERMINKFLK